MSSKTKKTTTGAAKRKAPSKSAQNVKVKIESLGEETVKIEDFDEEVKPKPKQTKRKATTVSKTTNAKKIKKETSNFSDDEHEDIEDIKCSWEISDCLASNWNLSQQNASVLINMFDEGATVPFLARYRRNLINNFSAEELRNFKQEYEHLCMVQHKIKTSLKSAEKKGKLDGTLRKSILNAQSLDELDYICSVFKETGKKTLAQKAKDLGLENAAINILTGSNYEDISKYQADKEGLKTVEEIQTHITHLIAHMIATDPKVLDFIRTLQSATEFTLESKKSTATKKAEEKPKKATVKSKPFQRNVDELKFQNYFDFKMPVNRLKAFHVMAINRGESLKILSVKITAPDNFYYKFKQFCKNNWTGSNISNRLKIIEDSIEDGYKRLIFPLVVRNIRSRLKKNAEADAIGEFTENLHNLLMSHPTKGCAIVGIDPGYAKGCKVAAISSTGTYLTSTVIYLHQANAGKDNHNTAAFELKRILDQANAELIAIGNGSGCRDVEVWISNLIKAKFFYPKSVKYSVVNESGASIYSCGQEAKKEFSDLDPLIVSAISIARRVQDPLAEYLKVEPHHLGVGMYQHDVPQKRLENALDEVVSQCVSFVGVDLNTASMHLLCRVAGLTQKRAQSIVDYRNKNGMFTCRFQLKDIKGIGDKSFEQCAGFLRVNPGNSRLAKDFYSKPETTPLDCTWVHPESYEIADKMLLKLNAALSDLGKDEFMMRVKSARLSLNIESLTEELKSDVQTLNLILDVFEKPLNYDIRNEYSFGPIFKQEIMSADDITIGMVLTGEIRNVTSFGAFVDIGVGINGLIHTSQFNGLNLQLGEHVEVSVINLDLPRKRIQLRAIKKF